MLELLRIRNLAVIDSAEITFGPGLNILSGETGAGKSIVMSAIGLLLGDRAQQDWIRNGCEEAVVEGLFNLEHLTRLKERIESAGYPVSNNEVLIRRILNRQGKNRIYINSGVATLSALQELTQGLIDLCGQHEHQSLLKTKTQVEVLDRYGGLTEKTETLNLLLKQLRALQEEIEVRSKWNEDRVRRRDFLAFQLEEISSAQVQLNEDDRLSAERKILQSTERRLQIVQGAEVELCSEVAEYPSILERIKGVRHRLNELNTLDAGAGPILESIDRVMLELEETTSLLSEYGKSCDLDPERLEFVSNRLTVLSQLKRKYGGRLEDVLSTYEALKEEFDSLDSSEEKIQKIREELRRLLDTLSRQVRELSKSRKAVSKVMGDSITSELHDLKMESSVFSVLVEYLEDQKDWQSDALGNKIEFLICTNAGESAKPLGRVASGGELSRVMLAIRRVAPQGQDESSIGVYLFDEIDSGMSGQTAFAVGRKLKAVARNHQVICITHLPQVAAFSDVHRVVKKSEKKGRTVTEIVELSPSDRRIEIARMLGGEDICESSLKNADDLILQAEKSTKKEKRKETLK